ncbi:Endoribonuclease L-PSP/chorismate mutase-like protein [Xylogone sp. PMI_703]|nr:Endoribonuclease L-PSP/chorismate mutase-like protein [Xylogone sp. PMI_703]
MPAREAVVAENAPPPVPFLSQAIKCNGMVYVSGNVGLDPDTKRLVEGTVGDRTRQTLNNIKSVLEAAGSSIDDVCKVNIFITTMDNYAGVNKVYEEFFTKDPKPCRTCVAVYQLPLGTDVEIECVATIASPTL